MNWQFVVLMIYLCLLIFGTQYVCYRVWLWLRKRKRKQGGISETWWTDVPNYYRIDKDGNYYEDTGD